MDITKGRIESDFTSVTNGTCRQIYCSEKAVASASVWIEAPGLGKGYSTITLCAKHVHALVDHMFPVEKKIPEESKVEF